MGILTIVAGVIVASAIWLAVAMIIELFRWNSWRDLWVFVVVFTFGFIGYGAALWWAVAHLLKAYHG